MTQHFESRISDLVGTVFRLKEVVNHLGYQRVVGIGACKALLPDI